MELLFQPGNIGTMKLKNRIIMTPLHMCYTMEQELAFLEARAKGGAASVTLILGIAPDACSYSNFYVNDTISRDLEKLAAITRKYDCRSMVQLLHVGRNSRAGDLAAPKAHPVAPSPIPSPIFECIPKELTVEQIDRIIEQYINAALICKDAGIDGIEINCSAGYLLPQFLSPHTNKRKDNYGGDRTRRMLFPKQVIRSVRRAVGPVYPISLRLSADSMIDRGYTLEDMKVFATEVEPYLDVYNVNGGWYESKIPQTNERVSPGEFAYLAKAIKDIVDLPTIACNRINSGEVAEEILSEGLSDFVGCARAFVVEPEFVNKIQKGLPYKQCIACNKCMKAIYYNETPSCKLNPAAGNEWRMIS